MTFGEYIKKLRTEKELSQRDLAEKSGVSNSEISRMESGERKKPSPSSLKAIAPFLGVAYEELLLKAGYIEEVIEHQGYFENVYRDENGRLIDIVTMAKDMFNNDSNWAALAYRVSTSELSKEELEIIKVSTESLLAQFLKHNKNKKK